MAADHNTNQCLEKHGACLVLVKTMHLLAFGKGLAVFQQAVLEKTTCRQRAFVQFWFLKLYSFEG